MGATSLNGHTLRACNVRSYSGPAANGGRQHDYRTSTGAAVASLGPSRSQSKKRTLNAGRRSCARAFVTRIGPEMRSRASHAGRSRRDRACERSRLDRHRTLDLQGGHHGEPFRSKDADESIEAAPDDLPRSENQAAGCQIRTVRSRSALPTTLTEDSAIAAAATIGDSKRPNVG